MRLQTTAGAILLPHGTGTLPRRSRVGHAIVGIALLYVWCALVGLSVWIPIGQACLFVLVLVAQVGFSRTASLQLKGSRIVYRGLPGVRSTIDRTEVVGAAFRYFGHSLAHVPD